MNIKIGSTIRHLRSKAGITQESLASHLGISVQAVSRWESGACYPDLEFIPAIAAYFGVSTDLLLGVDALHTKEAVEACRLAWTKAFKNAEHERALEIVNRALLAMPTNYELMLMKGKSLFTLAAMAEEAGDGEGMQAYFGEVADYLYAILRGCNDGTVRFEALQWVFMMEYYKGNMAKTTELIAEFPAVNCTKNAMLYRFPSDPSKAVEYARTYLQELFFEFLYCARELSKNQALCDADRIQLLEGMLSLLPTVIGGEVYGEFEFMLDPIYQDLFELTGNEAYGAEVGLHEQKYADLPEEFVYRSVFLDGVVFDHKNAIHSLDGTDQ